MEDMTEYLDIFLAELDENISLLNTTLIEVEKNPQNTSLIKDLIRAAHTVKGMAATMQYDNLTKLTHTIEDHLLTLNEISPSLIQVLFKTADKLKEFHSEIKNSGTADTEVDSLINELKNSSEIESIPAEELRLGTTYKLKINFSKNTKLLGARGYQVLRALETISQIIHSDPSVAVLEDGKLIGDVDMEIISYQSEAEIRKKLDEVGDINEIIVTKLLEDIRPAIKGIKTRRDIQSVRVNLDRLDSVIDLLGELVITRGRFQSLISRVTPEMSEQFQIFDNTINSIQDTVMNLRMVNLSQIFDTFPRAVRDIAKTRGLEIDLLLQGTHILLDRSVVDQVHEALLHLVRNAAIHGIENLDGRKSANKSSTGRIRLSAKRERGEVVFEVEDDGAGLNIERIREQGIKQKLISENTPLTRSQVASLIFRPGFSTATEVTEIAGRGVGMDIVKATIDEISGSIEVRTILGKGTKFIIRVPQTLAIIDALIVKAAKNSNQLFAIPLLNVERIFNLRDNVIKKQAEGNYIDWEGRVIRILNLEQILATHGLLNEFIPEEEVIPSRRKTKSSFQDKIILWEKADKRVGLRVSQIIEQREIVTKSLDEISEDIQGFSGATILGYDQVALIIDPDRLDQYNIS